MFSHAQWTIPGAGHRQGKGECSAAEEDSIEWSEEEEQSIPIAASFLLGKISNCRKVLERAVRDHAMLVDVPALTGASTFLKETLQSHPHLYIHR